MSILPLLLGSFLSLGLTTAPRFLCLPARLSSPAHDKTLTYLIANIYGTPPVHWTDLHKFFHVNFMTTLSSKYYRSNVLYGRIQA